MPMRLHATRLSLLIVAFISFLAGSCGNAKKALYFSGIKDDSTLASTEAPDSRIQPNDLLSINVSSLNPDATRIFNASSESDKNATNATASVPTVSGGSGYLVSKDGQIQFPVLGNLKVAGLTKDELKNKLTKELTDKKYLVDPIITVRFLNFRVTVLGEVAKPGVILVPSEKISMLEALGLAGDLTIYAKRNNILLIREENGKKATKRLNLNDANILNSPYYYLKTNDVIYVEPGRAKVASASNVQTWLPILLGSLTLATVLLDRFID